MNPNYINPLINGFSPAIASPDTPRPMPPLLPPSQPIRYENNADEDFYDAPLPLNDKYFYFPYDFLSNVFFSTLLYFKNPVYFI